MNAPLLPRPHFFVGGRGSLECLFSPLSLFIALSVGIHRGGMGSAQKRCLLLRRREKNAGMTRRGGEERRNLDGRLTCGRRRRERGGGPGLQQTTAVVVAAARCLEVGNRWRRLILHTRELRQRRRREGEEEEEEDASNEATTFFAPRGRTINLRGEEAGKRLNRCRGVGAENRTGTSRFR